MMNPLDPASRLMLEAVGFAARAHHGQLRKDGKTPYHAHVCRVALIARHVFGIDDPAILTAALLHDTIEDTTTDFDDVTEQFGPEIASWVALLSKDKRLEDGPREDTYRAGLRTAPWQVKICKLGDICDNLMDSAAPVRRETGAYSARSASYLQALDTPDLPPAVRRAFQITESVLRNMQAPTCRFNRTNFHGQTVTTPFTSQRPTNVRYVVLLVLCLATVINYVQRNCIGPAETTVREGLHLTKSDTGDVISVFFIVYALMQVPSGWVSQRWGPRLALTVFAVGWSVALGLSALATNYWDLFAARVAMGALQAGIFPCCTLAMAAWLPPTRRAFASAMLNSFMLTGGAAGCRTLRRVAGTARLAGALRTVRAAGDRVGGVLLVLVP